MFASRTTSSALAADNQLTEKEKKDGWILLFDGNTLNGWMTSSEKPSKRPVEDHCINPHNCGGYMMIHEKQWDNFVLSLDFKIAKDCNSGVFLRTFPLEPLPGKDVGFNGIEVQILDSPTAAIHRHGCVLRSGEARRRRHESGRPVEPLRHHLQQELIAVELNGEKVAEINLDEWTEPGKRPDGTPHKFGRAMKDQPRKGISVCKTTAVNAGSRTSSCCR